MAADSLPRLEVAAGALVFGQGEPGGSLLVIEEGEVALSRSFLGGEVELRTLGPGAPLGVASLHREEPREATARAVMDTKLLRLEPPLLTAAIRERPDLALRLLAAVASQLTASDEGKRPASQVQPGSIVEPVTDAISVSTLREPSMPVVAALLWHSSGASFALPDHGEVTLGRGDGSSGRRPDIDLSELAQGRSVSRVHARLSVSDSRLVVREEGAARNGTFVNGARLGPGEKAELSDGATLRLGLVELQVLRN